MKKTLLTLAALSLPTAAIAQQWDGPLAHLSRGQNPDGTPVQISGSLEEIADAALERDEIAWDFVEGVTTEVGPRQAGTEAETRGRVWAVEWLRKHGFQNVADEPFEMNTWVPGDLAKAHVTGPFPQELVVQPLGNSAATPQGGLEAEVVFFRTVAELRAAPAGSLDGKIAYISHQMRRAQDG